MSLRYAFDLGSNYISWCVYELESQSNDAAKQPVNTPIRLRDMGVHTFHNGRQPVVRDSLGALRREQRGRRRLQARAVQRRTYVLSLLDEHGLLPRNQADRDAIMRSDPYDIRRNAVDQKVSLHQLGRALFHLNKHRGYNSNRRSTPSDDTGKIAAANKRTRELLIQHGCKTIGQYLALRQSPENPRDRLSTKSHLQGQGTSAGYEFYPTRDMVEYEFNLLWEQQAKHHATLSESLKTTFLNAIFHQRPLKPAEPGRCLFNPTEKRLAQSTQLAQSIRIAQQLSTIELQDAGTPRTLSLDERHTLTASLMSGTDLTWVRIRRLLDLNADVSINLELDGEKKLLGNAIARTLVGTSSKTPGPLHNQWASMSSDEKDTTLDRLRTSTTDDEIIALAKQHLQLDDKTAKQLADTQLPVGYLNMGETAAALIVKQMSDKAINYEEAIDAAGLKQVDASLSEIVNRLPAYQRVPTLQQYLDVGTQNADDSHDIRYGRISNPTVHIALNQLRRTVNALIDRYGKPADIVIELSQELKQTEKQRSVYQRRINARHGADEVRKKQWLEPSTTASSEKKNAELLLRIRLWEELGEEPRQCLYTGQTITSEMLYSDQVAIDHILPLSQTLDDSASNKTVAIKKARQLKRELTPADAALAHPAVFDLALIRVRTRSLAKNKRWRFEADAMERFDPIGGFLARFLNDNRYVSRIVQTYLDTLFPQSTTNANQRCVQVNTGQLTASLRNIWRLQTDRDTRLHDEDYRHHAVHAAVVGVTDSTLLQQLSASATDQQQSRRKHIALQVEEPYLNFRQQVLHQVSTLVVSARAKHSIPPNQSATHTTGKLHQEMNYGLVADIAENTAERKVGNVVRRVPVSDLTASMITRIRDKQQRDSVTEFVYQGLTEKNKVLTRSVLIDKLSQWSTLHDIKRVRVLWPLRNIKPICNTEGEPYRFVKPASNRFMDIYETDTGEWIPITTDSFSANTTGSAPVDRDLTFIMRLHNHDFLQLFNADTGENCIMKIHTLDAGDKRVKLALSTEGGVLQSRHSDPDDAFRWDYAAIVKLKARRARRVRFTAAGRMKTVAHGVQ